LKGIKDGKAICVKISAVLPAGTVVGVIFRSRTGMHASKPNDFSFDVHDTINCKSTNDGGRKCDCPLSSVASKEEVGGYAGSNKIGLVLCKKT
jgi:hypothetical protein